MLKEKTSGGEKKRKQPLQTVEEDRVLEADTPVQNVVVDDEEQVRSRVKGKRLALERVSIDNGTDASPGNLTQPSSKSFGKPCKPEKVNGFGIAAKAKEFLDELEEYLDAHDTRIEFDKIRISGTFITRHALQWWKRYRHQHPWEWQGMTWAEFDKRVDKLPRLDDYARIGKFLEGLKREPQAELFKLAMFPERYSDLLKEAEKLTDAKPEYASTGV
ncbi:hypothetical protein R1sor_014379 [Riccia sorocarpa]|uniref:Retrotransposon gag domain-containing protein n=1 Tax=Riccia sorocarpa TaxID=122646 RepID=A0ABD3HD18_9MARC